MYNNEILRKMVELGPTIIPIIIAYFEFVGLFGNINLVVATLRKKHLRTKHGVLLALTTFYQTMCLFGEIGNFLAALHGGFLRQDLCFYIMIPYIFFCCMQSTMFLMLSLDTLFSVLFPLKHMVCRLWMYVCVISIPPLIYAVLIITMNSLEIIYGEMHNSTVIICNPMLSMDYHVADFWINFNGFSNLAVLGIYVCTYMLVMKKEKHQKELGRVTKGAADKQALISLLWLIAIFTSTWCTCMLSQVIASWMTPSDLTVFIESYAIIFAMMAYSVNYYVYFARNHSYRLVFMEQLGCLLPSRYRHATVWNRATQSYGSMHATGHAPSMISSNFKGKYGTGRVGNARGDSVRPGGRFETGRINSARTEAVRQLGARIDPARKASAAAETTNRVDILAKRKLSAPVERMRTISE